MMSTIQWIKVVWAVGALGLAAPGCATPRAAIPATFDVTLEVDFGPANRPPIRQTVTVARGATSDDLVAKVCTLQKGGVCCDIRETAGIDGVMADPMTNRWWTVSINGSKKVSPYRTRLKPGDLVRWEYRQYAQ